MTPTPRSRSSDNLERYSPLGSRKCSLDVSSPTPTNDDSRISRESSEGSIAAETHISLNSSSPSSVFSKGISPDSNKIGK